jgi:hypothetical protein
MNTRFYRRVDNGGNITFYRAAPNKLDAIWNGTAWVEMTGDAFARRLYFGDPEIEELPNDPTK